jgi:outer membrane receptor protein involved in Fe transport
MRKAESWIVRVALFALALIVTLPMVAFAQEGDEVPVEEAVSAEDAPAAKPVEEAVSAEDAPAAKPVEEAVSEEDAPAAKPVEEIVVTGTRIGRSNLEDFAHITVLNSEDIALSGVNTIDELLNKMPSITLQGLSKQNNNGGNGLVMVDLRNMGVGRTLVLVNGRRFIKSATGAGVDLNNIPVQMIDRVEVLLDGASAVYGSDAIGGVINIILKDDFEGFQIDLSGGITDRADGAELTVSGTGGVSGDRGNFMANFTYTHRNEIWQKDRGWAKNPVVFEDWASYDPDDPNRNEVFRLYGSGTNTAGRYIYASNRDIDGDGVPGTSDDWNDVIMSGDGRSFRPFNGGGCVSENGSFSGCTDPFGDRYNYGADQWLTGQLERFNISLLGHYDFTENLKVYMEGMYTNRWSRNQLAPQPIGFGTNTYQDGLMIPADSAGIPQALADDINAAESPYLIGLRRMGGVGNRMYDNESDTMRLVTGVAGDITDSMSFDLYFNYGHHQNLTSIFNSVNRTKMEDTLYNDTCSTKSSLGCVPGDYYGTEISSALRNYIGYTDHEITGWDMFVLAGNVKSELFDLPGGSFTAVLGAETRKEWGYNQPSPVTVAGDSAGNGLDPTEGSYNAQDVYAEISLPLLKDMIGVDSLSIDLAARFSHFNTFGSGMTYRAGLTWAPVKDIRLRGVFSTAFRAPDIGDLYGGTAVSYEALTDPCANWGAGGDATVRANCQAQGVPEDWTSTGSQIRTNIGGNPELEEETALVANGGIVFTPSFLPKNFRASATFDFYFVEVDNAISGAPPQWILDTCYGSEGMSHPNCALIGARNTSNEVTYIDATLQNVSLLETSGMDLTVMAGFDFALFGLKKGMMNLDLRFHGNYLLNYDETIAGEKVEYAGTITSGSGSYSNFRFNLHADFSGELGPGYWSLGNRFRFVDGAKVFGVEWDEDMDRWDTPTHHLPSVVYWDLVVSYTVDQLTFIVGVDNLTDKDPPFFPEGGQNANILTYDFLGRYVFSRLSYKF